MIKKIFIGFIIITIIVFLVEFVLGNKLDTALSNFDTQFHIGSEEEFSDSLTAIRELIEVGNNVISVSRTEDIAKQAYSEISKRIYKRYFRLF